MLSLRTLPHRPVRLRAPLVEDRRGDERRDWTAAVESDPFPARIEMQAASESTEPGRQPQTTTWLLLTNLSDLTTADRVLWDGATYEVDGPPRLLISRRRFHHLEASLLRVAG